MACCSEGRRGDIMSICRQGHLLSHVPRLRGMRLAVIRYIWLLVALLVALEPAYVHPDEHMQSVEVMMQKIFGLRGTVPWEFQPEYAARSFAPLWIFMGPALVAARLFNAGPRVVLGLLRIQGYFLYVSLTRVAVELVGRTKLRRSMAAFLLSTTYVVGAFQSHTFSNSIETLLAVAAVGLLEVVIADGRAGHRHVRISGVLGFLIALGLFNRVTFAGYLGLPCIVAFWQFYRRQWRSLAALLLCFLLTSGACIWIDTLSYGTSEWVITPLNNLLYNMDEENLAQHGLHPRYTHILVNLPMLLGPGLLFALGGIQRLSLPLLSCVSGVATLSLFKHQEARFLLPVVPLFLMSVDLTKLRTVSLTLTLKLWLAFNGLMVVIMGVGHQRGVITALHQLREEPIGVQVWWKTYSPPTWVLMNEALTVSTTNFVGDDERIDEVPLDVTRNHVIDLKGCNIELLNHTLSQFIAAGSKVHLIVPDSVAKKTALLTKRYGFDIHREFRTLVHLDLDHLDWSEPSSFTPGLSIYTVT
ncbi:AFR395Cp [Eremothecium gossypii ATCC 10895]|nr:AFR395Cp [Eremothecium gossypii ATCC 10895]AAS53766.2 AFR395Cp [Eremothecium gossypii ATCC 10895]AEY98078.1 FAFR395Cp [Eremothecium gossypii FDAG1]